MLESSPATPQGLLPALLCSQKGFGCRLWLNWGQGRGMGVQLLISIY